MFQTSYLGFSFAGPAFIWAWLVVLFGQMMVALQFAELSAHYPLAGSVYQWSKQVAGKAWSWNTGWMYLCAQIVTVPAVALAWQVILPQISTRFQIFKCTPSANCPIPATRVQQPGLRQERDPARHRHDHADHDHQRDGRERAVQDQQHRRRRRAGRRQRPGDPVPDPRQPLARPTCSPRRRTRPTCRSTTPGVTWVRCWSARSCRCT